MAKNERRGNHRIQKGTGKARCQYCSDPVTTEEWEVTIPPRSSDPYEDHYHYHLFSSGQCAGWIYHEWEFVTQLLYHLAEVGGDDYLDTINMLIKAWEEGS